MCCWFPSALSCICSCSSFYLLAFMCHHMHLTSALKDRRYLLCNNTGTEMNDCTGNRSVDKPVRVMDGAATKHWCQNRCYFYIWFIVRSVIYDQRRFCNCVCVLRVKMCDGPVAAWSTCDDEKSFSISGINQILKMCKRYFGHLLSVLRPKPLDLF